MAKKTRRSNSGPAPSKWQRAQAPRGDISRLLDPKAQVVEAADGSWFVQHIAAVNALKTYTCPECHRPIRPGLAHLVIWREDHLFGQQRAIEERRHWHSNCWKGRRFR